MKIAFVYENRHEEFWMDGLYAALDILSKDHHLVYINLATDPIEIVEDVDFILGWGAFGSLVDRVLRTRKEKKGLCIGGNANPPHKADEYDVLFHETKWYRPLISYHDNIVHAFGVNTDIFNEVSIPMPIVWDHIGVGSLSNWKRWEKMTEKEGRNLVIGEYQEDNEQESGEIAKMLLRGGVAVAPMVNPYDLATMYHWSRKLYIPADIDGGGERAILEARASGLPVEIEDDNLKLKELVDCEIYDHHYYANQLRRGIMSVV